MRKFLLVFLLLSFTLFVAAQNGTEPVKVTDLLKVKTLGTLNLNNDGSLAVFTVLSIEPEAESKLDYKYSTQIWIVPTDGSAAPRQLTTAKESASQAVFSPDGKQIVFVRAVDGKSQLFLLGLEGGEAIQLTKSKYGASSPKWSPDGKQLLFSGGVSFKDLLNDSLLNPGKAVPLWSLEKPGLDNTAVLKNEAKGNPDGTIEEVRAYLEKNAEDRKAKVITKLNHLDEMDVNGDMSFTHFFIMEARPGAKAVNISTGFCRFNSVDFTPDGKQLIINGNAESKEHPDRVLENCIYLANTDGSGLKKILGEKDKSFSSPRVSPSGKWLAFQYSGTSFVSIPTLALIPMGGSFKEKIDLPFDRNKSFLNWSKDEKYIYFTSQSNGGQPLYRVNLSKGINIYPPLSALKDEVKVEQLTGYESGIANYDLAGDKLVYVKTEVANPFELYVADATTKNTKRLSSFNATWIAGKQLSFPEKHSFKNEKGMTIEYWVMKPTNYQPGKKFPLLLEIHGGPSAMWGPGESSMWHEYQYFCGKGYGVVYANPRGSGGYGLDFLRGNINDWGTGPTKDVLTALDKTVAEGWADTSKLMVTGGSYAGYLVAWIIAHDQRFAAACSQRGVYDLATFFGEGNAWRLVPNYFGGYPWEATPKATLARESPINYVQNIKTPYIIFHGDNDRRTGFVQSEMLYKSLKVLGRPVEYVRHPGGTHELTRSGHNRQRIDQMLRTWEFFERFIH
ncbi:MAG TPA: S9 family peptidase [Chitinophagaceae bacterium]|nr:S9 family peptidase [Chitinophagaceae bacterium]